MKWNKLKVDVEIAIVACINAAHMIVIALLAKTILNVKGEAENLYNRVGTIKNLNF